MAVRRCPYTTGETIFHSDRGCQYTSEQFSQHLGRYEIIASTGRTGVCWAGAWAEVGGCDPQGTRGSIRWCIPQEARPSGTLPPGSSWNTRSETTPLRPGVQDAGRGRPGAPSSKTSSLKDRFQSCPRHAQQSSPDRTPRHRQPAPCHRRGARRLPQGQRPTPPSGVPP